MRARESRNGNKRNEKKQNRESLRRYKQREKKRNKKKIKIDAQAQKSKLHAREEQRKKIKQDKNEFLFDVAVARCYG